VVQLPPKEDVLKAASLLLQLSFLEKPGTVVLVSPKAWELRERENTDSASIAASQRWKRAENMTARLERRRLKSWRPTDKPGLCRKKC
jgi:hypothetical protein